MRITYQNFVLFCGLAITLLCLPTQTLLALEFPLPPTGDTIIGEVVYKKASSNETLLGIGQRYNLGLNSMVSANAGLGENQYLSSGTYVEIPAQHLLPPLPHNGIVINLPEMRMYYYPKDRNVVLTYPIGIGKIGKTIPIAMTTISRKSLNPNWTPPDDIREFNREKGIELPEVMPPGPDNPLGPYAIYLGIPTYLIHSTIFPESVGRRASFGCIRMHETDIKEFYPIVEARIPVAIIDMPNKVGWSGDHLYLEAHPPLEERSDEPYVGTNGIVTAIQHALPANKTAMIDWQLVSYLASTRDGVPHDIGFTVN